MTSETLECWGIISARSAARPGPATRQCYYLGDGCSIPLPSGRFLIVWDDGGCDVFWAGVGNGVDGLGWTDSRAAAREYIARDYADAELSTARDATNTGRWELVLVHEAA